MTKLFKKFAAIFILFFAMSLPASAELLASVPASQGDIEISLRIANVPKTISNLYPTKLFEAITSLPVEFGLQEAALPGMFVEAIEKSNVREFTAHFAFAPGASKPNNIGFAFTLDGADAFFEAAASAGKFTAFDLANAAGESVLAIFSTFAGNPSVLKKNVFNRGDDGLFVFDDDLFVAIEGNALIAYEKREMTIAAAKSFKEGKSRFTPTLEADDAIFINISKAITGEGDFRSEYGIAYVDDGFKVSGVNNAYEALPSMLKKNGKSTADVPIVGTGDPFLAMGDKTRINGIGDIESFIMMLNDDSLTASFANLLSVMSDFGIKKQDFVNLASGVGAFVFGLDVKILGMNMPLGMYVALAGKDGAAANIVNVVAGILSERAMITETKVAGWDKVYTVLPEQGVPNVLALRGETLLFGLLSPESLAVPLTLDSMGVKIDPLELWFYINFDGIWKASKSMFHLFNLVNSLSGKPVDKDLNDALQSWFASEIPVKNFGLWFESLEKFSLDFTSNPNSTPDFWLGLIKVIFQLNQ